jgi:hypothetical protein
MGERGNRGGEERNKSHDNAAKLMSHGDVS